MESRITIFLFPLVCLNSFKREEIGDFARARLLDLEDFFNEKTDLERDDRNLSRIRAVLEGLDSAFGAKAENISSRAVAVSAYLFAEGLYLEGRTNLLSDFAGFYIKLLEEISQNMDLIRRYKNAKNSVVMEEFQKHILQASVERLAIRRRDQFLKKAFGYFMNPQTKVQLIGSDLPN